MLSDEEKKAIDLLKNIDKQKCVMLECPVVKNNIERQLKIIELNRTIRKQSKEIEELKEKNEYLPSWVSKKYVSKDKIKAKIEELDDGIKRDMINYEKVKDESWKLAIHRSMAQKIEIKKVLQSLLEKE